ncbi:MAG: S-methyl-5-thioribose-1-phosphate isomerase [Coriobacteriia bacterium]|nr:S-methyl-5-thioribose-1-phosphate isomerase [Coriobacteriia bacterium]MCL2750537.1 S-methyl-5-thioribose-1-phosphate isomerase [Coriobacteriia bacterium]
MEKGVESLPRTLELITDPQSGLAKLCFVEQNQLPHALVISEATQAQQITVAIKTLAVRGAPAIGVAGAAAIALWAINECEGTDAAELLESLEVLAAQIIATRPTAVNLSWGVKRVMHLAQRLAQEAAGPAIIKQALFNEVKLMEAEDEAVNRRLGKIGAALLPEQCRVLTHCNAGSLATVFFGTALGVVHTAASQGKIREVFSCETRPVRQGARLTTWELSRAGIPCTLLCDDAAAVLMAEGKIDVVLVGADRVCKNGDTANKIGTYNLAVLARHHGLPFYIAAPSSTIDTSAETGKDVVIEQRSADEVSLVLPDNTQVFNPAFDITPHDLITAIITERGAFKPSELAAVY